MTARSNLYWLNSEPVVAVETTAGDCFIYSDCLRGNARKLVGKDFGEEIEILCPVVEAYRASRFAQALAPRLGSPTTEMWSKVGPLLVAEVIRIHGELFERFGCTHVAGVIGEINRDGLSEVDPRNRTKR